MDKDKEKRREVAHEICLSLDKFEDIGAKIAVLGFIFSSILAQLTEEEVLEIITNLEKSVKICRNIKNFVEESGRDGLF